MQARFKPNEVKRLVATFIDAIITLFLILVLTKALGVVSSYIGNLLGYAIGAGFWLLRDALPFAGLDGSSIGKKLMSLKAVQEDGANCDPKASFKRNLTLSVGHLAAVLAAFLAFIPFIGLALNILGAIAALALLVLELIKIFTDARGLRLGDLLANTHVIELVPQAPAPPIADEEGAAPIKSDASDDVTADGDAPSSADPPPPPPTVSDENSAVFQPPPPPTAAVPEESETAETGDQSDSDSATKSGA